jgi:hypothetical protein
MVSHTQQHKSTKIGKGMLHNPVHKISIGIISRLFMLNTAENWNCVTTFSESRTSNKKILQWQKRNAYFFFF